MKYNDLRSLEETFGLNSPEATSSSWPPDDAPKVGFIFIKMMDHVSKVVNLQRIGMLSSFRELFQKFINVSYYEKQMVLVF